MPYLTAWHRAYRELGFTFIGVHTPEYAFAKDVRQVEAAVRRLGLEYPVVLDNNYQTWDAFANRYWPSVYLIDAAGYIRFQHHGEGDYETIDAALRALAAELNPGRPLPPPVSALRDEDKVGAVCFRTTPELHAGYHQGALGNPAGYPPRDQPANYQLPDQRLDNYFYAEGLWRADEEYLALAEAPGALVLPYHAATANAVLSPSADPTSSLPAPTLIRITQDGHPLTPLTAGEDILFESGQSFLRVDSPRSYQIAKNPDATQHELRLDSPAPGLTLYAFSFSTCTVGKTSEQ